MSGKALDAGFEDLKIPQKPIKVKPGVKLCKKAEPVVVFFNAW